MPSQSQVESFISVSQVSLKSSKSNSSQVMWLESPTSVFWSKQHLEYGSRFGGTMDGIVSHWNPNPCKAHVPPLQDSVFLQWHNRRLCTQHDLFIDGFFASFQQLLTKFLIPHTHFFRYLQLLDFMRKQLPQFPEIPPSSDIDSLLAPVQPFKGIISNQYSALSSQKIRSLATIRHRWERDMGEILHDETHLLYLCKARTVTM